MMTELSKAVSEEDRVMVITKLVLNLMQQNGCWNLLAAQSHSNECKWHLEAAL
jgi:hypothetical protein